MPKLDGSSLGALDTRFAPKKRQKLALKNYLFPQFISESRTRVQRPRS